MSDTKQLSPPDGEGPSGAENRRRLPNYVYSQDQIRQAAEIETWRLREARKIKRVNRLLIGYAVMITILFVLQGGALAYALPLIRILPIYFYVRSDGVLEAAITTDSFPNQKLSDSAVQTFLWTYVRYRESYSWVEQDFNNHIVQTMSAGPVRDSYLQFSNGKNPNSYLAKFGRKGVIRVELIEVPLDYHPSLGGQPGRVTFHFNRKVWVEGEPEQKAAPYTVTLEFIQNYSTGFDVKDLLQYNPFRIVVTEYTGAVPLQVEPGSR